MPEEHKDSDQHRNSPQQNRIAVRFVLTQYQNVSFLQRLNGSVLCASSSLHKMLTFMFNGV